LDGVMSDPLGGFIPEGYHSAFDVEAASAARKKRYQAEQAEKKARAEEIAEAKKADAKARDARLSVNPFLPTFEPVRDADGNIDADGHAIDLAIASLALDPHIRLNPNGYYEAQRARFEEQKQEALEQIRQRGEKRREQQKNDELDKIEQDMWGSEPDWDSIED
jgi:hypothetical protein